VPPLDSKTRKLAEHLLARAEGALLPDALLAGPGAHLRPDDALAELGELAAATPALAPLLDERLAALAAARAAAAAAARAGYLERWGCAGVQRFSAGGDTRLYQLKVETFPRHVNNVILVVEPGHLLLFDVGSGLSSSRRDLDLGFAVVRAAFGEEVDLDRVDTAVVSHAHIDHFGGVHDLRARSRATLCVHELDARVLAHFDERVVVATKDVDVYLRRAGVGDELRADMLRLYGASRHWFRQLPADRVLRDGDRVGGGHRVVHVPGHCPGLICLQVRDVLLTSDHVLARITPHQFPQAITPWAGLEHYFESLAKVRALPGIRLALGGHEEPIADLPTRIDEIVAFHQGRLARVREILAEPRTLHEVTIALFGDQEGYGRLLAIEEAGAHVEYLHARGQIRLANLEEVAEARDPVLRYVA
jgi:glyoxylase-like metal-dependent hydrolase (beta-lactamase superfamily II)